jgi:hypothetical protein
MKIVPQAGSLRRTTFTPSVPMFGNDTHCWHCGTAFHNKRSDHHIYHKFLFCLFSCFFPLNAPGFEPLPVLRE